jgi:hypothetical protein
VASLEKQQHANDDKLKELVVYLSSLSEGDEYWGAVKLNKLLFYIDFVASRRFGKSVTGGCSKYHPAIARTYASMCFI